MIQKLVGSFWLFERDREDQHGACARITRTIRGFFFLNDTEKTSMASRKDDTHESRSVVKFFFFEQEQQPVVTTGAIGPSGPSACVRSPQGWACPASGCD